MDLAFKKEVHAACAKLLQEKIKALETELAAVRESAISETKSSMGDKYETGREMMMQERNRLGDQLGLYIKQLATLESLNPDKKSKIVGQGSMVQTDKTTFYLSVPIGHMNVKGNALFIISPGAPLAREMIGKRIGDSIILNSQSQVIKSLI